MSAGCPCPREAAHLGTAALFEGGSKLADQKFSLGAAVRLLKQITSYSFQRRVGSPQQEGNINKRGAFSAKKGWHLSLTAQPPLWVWMGKGKGCVCTVRLTDMVVAWKLADCGGFPTLQQLAPTRVSGL